MDMYYARVNGKILLPKARLVAWFSPDEYPSSDWVYEGGGACTVQEVSNDRYLVTFDAFRMSFYPTFDKGFDLLVGEQEDGTMGGVKVEYGDGMEGADTPFWLMTTHRPEFVPLYLFGQDRQIIMEEAMVLALEDHRPGDSLKSLLKNAGTRTCTLIQVLTSVDPHFYEVVGEPMDAQTWLRELREDEND